MRFAFLDRDGVINRFPGKGLYVTKPSDLKVFPQALSAIKKLTQAGYELAVVSNQGSVSRGLVTRKSLDRMTRQMLERIRRAGGRVQKVYYCVHQTSDHCDCKKPKTLLLKRALRGRRFDRSKIFFIGDSEEDIQTGINFGCRTILVLSGRLKKRNLPQLKAKPDVVKKDLMEAAQWLIKKRS
jgi:D-glycero-D-manno-heptose 1,7-bisphosphate phosphatase